MREWRQRQDNKYVMLNADEVFDFEHMTAKVNNPNPDLIENDEEEEEGGGEGGEEAEGITVIDKSTTYTRAF